MLLYTEPVLEPPPQGSSLAEVLVIGILWDSALRVDDDCIVEFVVRMMVKARRISFDKPLDFRLQVL